MSVIGAVQLAVPACMPCCNAIHKLKLNRYTRDALNKPVWRELTCLARTSCLLAKYTFYVLLWQQAHSCPMQQLFCD